MTTAPADRQAALDWAAGFRARRSALREALGAGTLTLEGLLSGVAAGEAAEDGAVRLLFVLESIPGAGKVATRRRLAELGLPETMLLRDLDAGQRRVVQREFGSGGTA